jgi:hypothetical protein
MPPPVPLSALSPPLPTLPPTMLCIDVPPPLQAALAEQGWPPPAYRLLSATTAAAAASPCPPDALAAVRLGVAYAATGGGGALTNTITAWRAAGLKAPFVLLGHDPAVLWATETLALPVRMGALLTRLRFYLALAETQLAPSMLYGAYRLDPARKSIAYATQEQMLTDKEMALLLLLAERAEPCSRAQLLQDVWGYAAALETHTLETHMYRLRQKLAALGGTLDIITSAAGYHLACA